MTTTPEGEPVWGEDGVRSATASVYGGHSDKKDYQNLGVTNPRTDISAAQFLRMTADMAAVARVNPYSIVTLVCNDTSPDDPTVSSVFQMTGNSTAGYEGDAPPSGFPTCTRVGNGEVTVVWPSSPSDEFSVSSTLALVHARAQVTGSTAYSYVKITKNSGVSWTFAAVDNAGSAISDPEIVIEVY